MNRRANATWFLILTVIIVLGLGLLAAHYAGLLSIVGSPIRETHQHNVFGQEWSLDSSYGNGTIHYVGTRVWSTSEDKTNTSILYIYTIPNTGDYSPGRYKNTFGISLDSIDLNKVQKLVIHRTATIKVSGSNYPEYYSTVMGTMSSWISGADGLRAGNKAITLGDIVITNDGAAVTIQSDEGRKVLATSNTPLHFYNTIMVTDGSSKSYGGGLTYTISSIEVTAKDAPIVTGNTVTTNTTTTTPPPAPTLFQKILSLIISIFHF